MKNKVHFLFLFWMSGILLANAHNRISITDFGLKPNTGEDTRPYLKKALEICRQQPGTTLYFPQGRYDFYPDKSINDEIDIMKRETTIGFSLQNLKDITFDGGGSEFIYHGKMQVAAINSCTNVTLQNFSVDWDRPMISQGEIIEATDKYLDLKVDKKNYPYTIENGKVLFLGENWKLPILTMYSTMYDKKSKEIAYNTWDSTLGSIFEQIAEETQEGILRFHGKPKIIPPKGTMVSLFHVRYFAQGISIGRSKDILLKNITLYHTLSNGFSGYRSENITMDNASVKVNDAKGRYFSSIADASHFSECKGTIKILNCVHTGQGDDFINVHGTSIKITKVNDKNTIEVASQGKGSGNSITVGDEYWFIDPTLAQRGETRTVKSKTKIYQNDHHIGYTITFDRELPANTKSGDFLECKTWTPRLEIRNCQILKRHRARGILVTTPKEVIIEDNYFRTAGTAILIEGDFNYWFESGANNNVHIRNNVFDNCLTSGNKHGSRAEWGEAVITITPSHIPQDADAEPYHKNIKIYDNTFKVFDAPLIRAVSTRALHFTGNKIIKTFDYKPYTWQQATFLLDGCRDVKINKNVFDSKYTTRDILIEHMRETDVQTDKKDKFIIKPIENLDTHMQWN